MKKSISVFAVLLVLFGYFSFEVKKEVNSVSGLKLSQGDSMESFTLPDLNNQQVKLDSVISSNRYVWINFWATWCGPCRREMPMMEEAFNSFKDQDFEVVAVNVGEDSAQIADYLDSHSVSFTVVKDPDEKISHELNIKMLPISFLVDSTGVVQEVGRGIQSSWEYTIEQKLESDN